MYHPLSNRRAGGNAISPISNPVKKLRMTGVRSPQQPIAGSNRRLKGSLWHGPTFPSLALRCATSHRSAPMAIWQLTFHLVPREAVEQLHGPTAIALAAFRPVDLETYDENAESPNYWAGRSPRSYTEAVEALLPPRKSWSPDALMFGDEEGDGIELWDDGVR